MKVNLRKVDVGITRFVKKLKKSKTTSIYKNYKKQRLYVSLSEKYDYKKFIPQSLLGRSIIIIFVPIIV